MEPEFKGWPKISRLFRDVIVTEKLDGTNAIVHVAIDGTVTAGSRKRWLTPLHDNHGFAAWVRDHEDELRALCPGYHYGEWWGKGIQRGYGLDEKRFSLFNTCRWYDDDVRPICCDVVPILYRGPFDTFAIEQVMERLRREGSVAAPGFMRPEGIVIYHKAGNILFKATLENDKVGKK